MLVFGQRKHIYLMPPKLEKTWKYDPFEDRKRFEDVRRKSIGDKDFVDYPEGKGKKAYNEGANNNRSETHSTTLKT